VEPQPGLQESVTITYEVPGNPAFSDFIAQNWQEMLRLDADPIQIVEALEARVQPLRPDCASRCMPEAAGNRVQIAACEWVCRDPLFSSRSAEEIAPDRFLLFAAGLRKLVSTGGLIVIESCNPGTVAIKGDQPWNTDGLLVHSSLAGGPYPSYVHLLANATGRAVAGPIGKIGADHMLAFISSLEAHRSPLQYRLVIPSSNSYLQ
jgi:hypothetical protein